MAEFPPFVYSQAWFVLTWPLRCRHMLSRRFLGVRSGRGPEVPWPSRAPLPCRPWLCAATEAPGCLALRIDGPLQKVSKLISAVPCSLSLAPARPFSSKLSLPLCGFSSCLQRLNLPRWRCLCCFQPKPGSPQLSWEFFLPSCQGHGAKVSCRSTSADARGP